MKNTASIIAIAGLLAACAPQENSTTYNVSLEVDSSYNGQMAFLTDFDSGEKIDSAVITNGEAIFNGEIETPVSARAIFGGKRSRVFIVEPGDIKVDSVVSGTPLNDELSIMRSKVNQDNNSTVLDSAISKNADNALGLYLFLDYKAYESDLAELNAELAKYPQFDSSTRIKKLKNALELKEETSVGKPFKDFEITYDGKTTRLSDYVGNGKYTLVDFWASWCGPCIRETKVIKQLYEQYGDKGLTVVGVAVWDEPENTLNAIAQHELPWDNIINTQNIATDIYGISSIPCIILFDPEGNIVSRDKQDEELINDVANAMK